MIIDLQGKVAIVTGSTKGIGKEIALEFARAHANVIIVSRNPEECESAAIELSRLGAKALPFAANLNNIAEIKSLICSVIDNFGKVDILVNNAGTAITKKAEDISEAEWDQVVDLNLKSVFFCSQLVGREMIKQGQGKIINIASILGMVAEKLVAPYCASKSGVIQLTKALALEWAQYGIRVNALCPGYVLTAINETVLKNPKVFESMLRKIPLKRLGEVSDIAGAALFMASDLASYMTGHALVVDGGWTAQ